MEAKRRKPNRKSTPTKLQNGSNSDHVIMVELDTTVPISNIQKIIGDRLKTNELKNYDIYLQDIPLDPKLCLYDQAVRVTGSVELSVQVESHGVGGKLTIVEIAKNMTDEEIKALGGQYNGSEQDKEASNVENEGVSTSESLDDGIPCDPTLWTQEQVYAWMLWIAKGYNLDPDMIKKPGMDGKKICALPIEDFFIKFPYGNIFWSHLSVLKKMTHPEIDDNQDEGANDTEEEALNLVLNDKKSKHPSSGVKSKANVTVQITNGSREPEQKSSNAHLNRSHTSNGQIQLWQFLLDLLTDANEVNVIKWVGTEGEFKFINPEMVARKWGERKGKPAMNYEKLSRALRYYYDGDMISKVTGKRFQYKFVCNLKEILGYDAAELSRMVDECHKKRKADRELQNANYTSIDVSGIIANGQFVAR